MMNYFLRIVICCNLLFVGFSGQATARPSLKHLRSCAKELDFSVVSSYESTENSPCIIYIEDAHCNYLAQREIARIIRILRTNNLCDGIAVEGSQGPILTDLCATFPVDPIRKKMAENMLKSGIISGEEYLCIYDGTPLPLYGVDEQQLYLDNVASFSSFVQYHSDITALVAMLNTRLVSAKQRIYHKELAAFDAAYESYRAGKSDVLPLIAHARSSLPDDFSLEQQYPVLWQAYRIITEQNKLSAALIDAQCNQLLLQLVACPDIDISDAAEKLHVSYLHGTVSLTDYCRRLYDLGSRAGFDMALYDSIKRYLWCLEQSSTIHAGQVDDQVQELADTAFRTLCATDREKELYALCAQWHRIERLINLQLDRNEYLSLNDIDVVALTQKLIQYLGKTTTGKPLENHTVSKLENLLRNNMNFYRLASMRDDVLTRNTLSFMQTTHTETAVLIAGGFHTDQITQYCKEQNISFAVVRPNKLNAHDFDQYSSVLLRSEISDYFALLSRSYDENYLRATSFFAQHSFDDIRRVDQFRTAIVFNAILGSIDRISYDEIFSVVRLWRTAYLQAVSQRHPTDSIEYRSALTLFDYLVTDLFTPDNITIDSLSQQLTILHNGSTISLSRDRQGNPILATNQPADRLTRIEELMSLKSQALFLVNTEVFIVSWTIADEQSPNYRHGDAHYSVKYIEALNARAVSPVVILPDDEREREETLRKYEPAISNDKYRFTFAVFDEQTQSYIQLNKQQIPIAQIELPEFKRPVLIHLASDIDSRNNQRITELNERFAALASPENQPAVIRIPTAGTIPGPVQGIDPVDLYMNPVERAQLPDDAVQSGFMVDQELYDIIGLFRKEGGDNIRRAILDEINEEFSNNRLQQWVSQLNGMTFNDLIDQHWTFRYLTEKSDAELAAFMHAAQHHTGRQVIFTFYKDTPADNRHIGFLKSQASFIDLTSEDNNVLDPAASVLVINLPPVDSFTFKSILASADSAVVSGENSLSEGLVLNKLGIGPSVLFKPTLVEHMAIIENLLSNNDKDFLISPLRSYAQLHDQPDVDPFASFNPAEPLSGASQVIYDTAFDPRTSTIMKAAVSESVYEVNGLNALTDIIADINSKKPHDEIVFDHNLSPRRIAAYITDEFFYNGDLSIHSTDDISSFVSDQVQNYIRMYINDMMLTTTPVELIERRISELSRALNDTFSRKLDELQVSPKQRLTDHFKNAVNDAIAVFQIRPGGHLFIPVVVDGEVYYRHDYANMKLFVPKTDDRTPAIETELLHPDTASRIMADLDDALYIKRLIDPLYVTDTPFTHYDSELLPPTFNHQNKHHMNEMKLMIALASLDYFRELVRANAGMLIDNFASADMRALYEYIQAVRRGDMPSDSQLVNRYIAFTTELTSDVKTGTTSFFRDTNNWQKEYEAYLSDIITQKTAVGDYTLAVRSVGSAIGKEAYSLASFVEQALLAYARTKVYADVTDLMERDKLAQQWVDRWDVRVYAFDNSVLRLAAAKEGIYLLDDAAMSFLSSHQVHNKLFEASYTGDGYYPIKRVNKRVRRWLVPVFVDLNKNYRLLEQFPAEITFAMNVLKYLNDSDAVVRSMKASTNPNYKSLVAYNINFNDRPADMHAIAGQPFTVPATVPVDFSMLHAIIQHTGLRNTMQINSLLGLPANKIGILNRYFQIAPYAQQVSQLFQPDPDAIELPQEYIRDFISEQIAQATGAVIAALPQDTRTADSIREALDAFTQIVSSDMQSIIRDTYPRQAPRLVEYVADSLDAFTETIQVADSRNVFVPVQVFGQDAFVHHYIDNQPFTLEHEIGEEVVKSDIVNATAKNLLVEEINDTHATRQLLEFIDFEQLFALWKRYSAIMPYYDARPEQIDALTDTVARIAVPFAKNLVQEFSEELTALYGRADIRSLAAYAQSLRLIDQPESQHPLIESLDFLAGELSKHYITQNKDDQQAWPFGVYTSFFREGEGWEPYLKQYVDDLILQKTATGDFTITARSIGASIGKEAYSIAGLIEQRLIRYASDNLFANIKSPQERLQAVDNWVALWDVRVYAMEFVFQRLATTVTGIYGLPEKDFFNRHQEYMNMFSEHGKTANDIPIVRMSDRLRRWVVPVQVNLNASHKPLYDRQAEITFAMNFLMYTDDRVVLENAIKATMNPRYKAYYAYNDKFFDYPVNHKAIAGQPQTLPAQSTPSREELLRVAEQHNVLGTDHLAGIFGIDSDTIGQIFGTKEKPDALDTILESHKLAESMI